MRTEDEIRRLTLEIIGQIAPEADIEHLDPAERWRNQFDFDSVDFMNFAVALQERLQIEIPEEDFPRLSSLDSCVAYLREKLGP